MKRRVELLDDYGNHITTVDAPAHTEGFEGADLRGANPRDALLVGTNLRNADLSRDNLGGSTSLQGASLADAVLNRAKLSGAKYGDRTIFPRGFSPHAAGMIEEVAD